MKDNNTKRNMFSKFFPILPTLAMVIILFTLAMVILSMLSMTVSAETKTAGSLRYVDDGYHETYWVDRNGNVVVVPLQLTLEKSEYEYTGKPIKPRVIDVVGTSLDKVSPRYDEHTHYDKSKFNVTYKNNTNIGTGTVYVSDKGNNITIKQDFTIKRSSDKKLLQDPLANYQVKIKKVTKASESFVLEWNNLNLKAVGYQVQYATNKKMKNAKTLRLKHYLAKSTLVQKLKKNKTYYVRVRAYTTKGKKQSTKWSPMKKVKTWKKAKYCNFPFPINTLIDEGDMMYWYHVGKRNSYKLINEKKSIDEVAVEKKFQKRNPKTDVTFMNLCFNMRNDESQGGEWAVVTYHKYITKKGHLKKSLNKKVSLELKKKYGKVAAKSAGISVKKKWGY